MTAKGSFRVFAYDEVDVVPVDLDLSVIINLSDAVKVAAVLVKILFVIELANAEFKLLGINGFIEPKIECLDEGGMTTGRDGLITNRPASARVVTASANLFDDNPLIIERQTDEPLGAAGVFIQR
jgi:hypothetical protein